MSVFPKSLDFWAAFAVSTLLLFAFGYRFNVWLGALWGVFFIIAILRFGKYGLWLLAGIPIAFLGGLITVVWRCYSGHGGCP